MLCNGEIANNWWFGNVPYYIFWLFRLRFTSYFNTSYSLVTIAISDLLQVQYWFPIFRYNVVLFDVNEHHPNTQIFLQTRMLPRDPKRYDVDITFAHHTCLLYYRGYGFMDNIWFFIHVYKTIKIEFLSNSLRILLFNYYTQCTTVDYYQSLH
jgi:hypothetical protein